MQICLLDSGINLLLCIIYIYDMLIRGINLFPYILHICLLESGINLFLNILCRYADMLIT